MIAERPKIARTGYRQVIRWGIRNPVFRTCRLVFALACIIEYQIDLCGFETRQFNVEVDVEEALQLDGENSRIPSGGLGQFVIRQDVGSFVHF